MQCASTAIPTGRLYGDLAYLYPLITPPEDYAEEAAYWRLILREQLGDGRHRVLELGVGGGHNLSHLTADVDAAAVDISVPMLAYCARLNPGVALYQGDMRTVRLRQKFAAVLIHDAISYMLTEPDLSAVFETAAAHLNPGGLLIISPDYFRDDFTVPVLAQATRVVDNTRVSYTEYSYDPDPTDTMIETIMTYYLETPQGLQIELDRHETGLFFRKDWLRLMGQAGFEAGLRSFPLKGLDVPYSLITGRLNRT